ncbi:hypothetical protein [Novosphingobium pokkalii]
MQDRDRMASIDQPLNDQRASLPGAADYENVHAPRPVFLWEAR